MGSIVQTREGRIEGIERRDHCAYRGIPFARPPIDELRFRAPEPLAEWSGVRAATSIGPSSPQVGPVNRLIRTLVGVAGSKQSQDCLYLNVWTPAPDRKRRPVMLWLHGGAFILGSGSTPLYSGRQLVHRGDVVVVTINYRLGALGFLSWNSLSDAPGRPESNLGLRDQIAALEWVRDNIEGFGGDPENVTLFGESAGAMSAGTLIGVPRAKGLFKRAILQSGAAHNVSSREQADRVAQHFVEALGVVSDFPSKLAKLSVMELMRAQARTSARIGLEDGIMAWQPCIDGDLVAEQPLEQIERGIASDVPLLIGSNRDEWKLFTLGDPRTIRMTEDQFSERLKRVVSGVDAEGNSISKLAAEAYYRVVGPRGGDPTERWASFQSDRVFHYPATHLADLHSRHQAETYAYLFEWSPPLMGRLLGACHGLELPFVFGTLRSVLPQIGLVTSRHAQRLSDRMQDAWIAFARTGSPGHENLPEWPAYCADFRNTMSLGRDCLLRVDPHQRGREFWEPLTRIGETRMMGRA